MWMLNGEQHHMMHVDVNGEHDARNACGCDWGTAPHDAYMFDVNFIVIIIRLNSTT